MMQRRFLIFSPLALAACHSAPPAQYFRIAPLPGAALQTPALAVQIRNIGVPAYLQQSGIAQPSGQYQFAASGTDLWAAPLPGMLQSVLVQDLSQRLPQASVTASSGMLGAAPDRLVEINVLRFDPDASGRIVLQAQIGLKAAKQNVFLATRNWQQSEQPTGSDTASAMAAMSALWASFADAIAQMVLDT